MAYPTKEAYFHTGTWDDETRSHPAMKFMEDYTRGTIDTRKFDGNDDPTSLGHAPDWSLQKSTGENFEGGEKAWSELKTVYAPFSEHVHDPVFLICWRTEAGWDMFGIANVSYNLKASAEGQTKGYGGKDWDGVLPTAFKFTYRKGGKQGVELARTEIYGDPSAALIQMLKRGMLKPEQLMQ